MAQYYNPKAIYYLSPEACRLDIADAVRKCDYKRLRGMFRSIVIDGKELKSGRIEELVECVNSGKVQFKLAHDFEKRYVADFYLYEEVRSTIYNNDIKKMRKLLLDGLPPNYINPYSSSTPLFMAIQYGTVEMMKLLLEYGAFVNICDYSAISWHAVGTAAYVGDIEKFNLLVEHGAWVPRDIVIYAAYSGNLAMLQRVEDMGFSVVHVAEERFMIPGETGRLVRPSVFGVALKKQYSDILAYLVGKM